MRNGIGLALVAALALTGTAVIAGDGIATREGRQDRREKQDKQDTPPKDDAVKAELGKPAPEFTLKDLDGKEHKLSDHKGKIVVLEWFDPSCPMCVWAYAEKEGEKGPLGTLPGRLKEQGVVWLTINSAGEESRGAALEANQEFARKHGVKTPVLRDLSGAVGRAYGAKTTPHLFVIDAKGVLVYQGALDNAPLGKVDGEKRIDHVSEAIKAVKEERKVETPETRSYG